MEGMKLFYILHLTAEITEAQESNHIGQGHMME